MKLSPPKLTFFGLFMSTFSTFLAVSADAEEALVFCRPNNMVSAHAYIAESERYFEQEGLSIRFESATNAKLCLDALLAGRVDVMTGAESAFVYVTPHDSDFRIIAFAEKNPETAIFYRKAGINAPKDLKGKRIGYLPGSCSVPFLSMLLEKHGVRWEDVSLVPLQPAALTQALIGNAVDAISIWEPWGANALDAIGSGAGVFRDSTLYSYESVVITRAPLIENRPAELQKLLRAFLKAEAFLESREEESIDILSKRISVAPAVLKNLWSEYTFRIELSAAHLMLLEDDFEILKRRDPKFSASVTPDFEPFMDRRILQAVAKERVQ